MQPPVLACDCGPRTGGEYVKVDLSNRVALVTGAARGIGKSIADTFADNGARVVYTDIDLDRAVAAAS